jgi:hypothetical protein
VRRGFTCLIDRAGFDLLLDLPRPLEPPLTVEDHPWVTMGPERRE